MGRCRGSTERTRTSIVQARFLDGAHEAVPGITQDHVQASEVLVSLT